jgi:protease-4
MAGLSGRAGTGPMVRHYPAPPTLLERIRTLFGLDLPLPLGTAGLGRDAIDPLTGRALSLGDPVLRSLRLLPPALWLSAGPEPLAVGPGDIEIDG